MNIDPTRKAVRQGDVLVVPVAPVKATTMTAEHHVVLAEGEATGHSHFIRSERVAMFRADEGDGGTILRVRGDAPVSLEHQEHRSLPIGPGDNRVMRQRTYVAGMTRRVQD